jgi:hypothetical protein
MVYPNFNGVVAQAEHYYSKNPVINGIDVYKNAVNLGNSGATETIDFAKGICQRITLDQSCTFTFLDPPGTNSQVKILLFVVQGGVGSFTITWPGATRFGGGIPPVLSTIAGREDLIELLYANGGWWVTASIDLR